LTQGLYALAQRVLRLIKFGLGIYNLTIWRAMVHESLDDDRIDAPPSRTLGDSDPDANLPTRFRVPEGRLHAFGYPAPVDGAGVTLHPGKSRPFGTPNGRDGRDQLPVGPGNHARGGRRRQQGLADEKGQSVTPVHHGMVGAASGESGMTLHFRFRLIGGAEALRLPSSVCHRNVIATCESAQKTDTRQYDLHERPTRRWR